MKRLILCAITSLFIGKSFGQKPVADPKIFWSENFKSGKLPDGWKNVDNSTQNIEWLVTNQPYPGSYQYQQQAPPIASKSRGYHLQFQAGYFVDEDQPRWIKKNWHPDTWMQTKSIDCSGKSSVILRFQQTFRYNNESAGPGAGLFVGVSTDGVKWTDYNVMNNAPQLKTCLRRLIRSLTSLKQQQTSQKYIFVFIGKAITAGTG